MVCGGASLQKGDAENQRQSQGPHQLAREAVRQPAAPGLQSSLRGALLQGCRGQMDPGTLNATAMLSSARGQTWSSVPVSI